MELTMLKGKIHRAVVTQAELHYVGSITIDADLMEASGMIEYQYVLISDIENGNRFETYIIEGKRGSGMICLNGAAARLVTPGDHIIIMAFASMTPEEAATHKPKVVFVNEENQLTTVTQYEKHGVLGNTISPKGSL